jgi:polysaccharide biosynthesis transport protein
MLHDKVAGTVGQVIQYPAASAAPQSDDPRVDLRELVQIVKRRRTSIFWTAAIPIVITLAYSFLTAPLYTASTQILIDPRDRRITNNEVNPEALAADGGVAVVESQLLIITSDMVLRRVITREHLDIDPEFGGEPTGFLDVFLRRALTAIGIDRDATDRSNSELQALRQIKRRIGVKRSERAFVADIYVTTESKDKSVRVADAIAQAYLDDQTESRAAASQRASGDLGARLDTLRNRVREAEDRVVQYKEQNNIFSVGGLLVNEQQLSEMNIQLNNARARTAESRSRFEQIQHAREPGDDAGAIAEAVQSQTIGQLRVHYAEMIRQRADLNGRFGPRHPDVATLNSQIRSYQGLINNELGRIATAAKNDLQRAEASERAIAQNLENLKKTAVSTSQASVRLRELEREVEVSRNIYQSFLARARETSEQQSIDSTNARVISKATPPRDKSWPPRGLLLAIALFAGLGVGTGVGLMREYLDDTLHTRKQLHDFAVVPVLAILPQLLPATRLGHRLFSSSHTRAQHANQPNPDNGRGSDNSALDQIAASSRGLLGALFEGRRIQRARTILISSTAAEEGKTTVALNLALAAAASGERVLLVDADFNRGTLSKNPAAKASAGLLDLLDGRARLSSLLLGGGETNFNFLPLGNATGANFRNPSSKEITQRLKEPAHAFSLVIIDCGSVSADRYVEPFADVADDILFVVRAGVTRKSDILAAFDTLHLNSRKIRGTILTSAGEGYA